MIAKDLIERLEGVRQNGPDKWVARCPAHDDRGPSLSIRQESGRVLLHCFAGCTAIDVLAAVGLLLSDLFDDSSRHHYHAGGYPPRLAYNPRDLLALIDRESLIVMIAAGDVIGSCSCKCLKPEDAARLVQARHLLEKVAEVLL